MVKNSHTMKKPLVQSKILKQTGNTKYFSFRRNEMG